jgi:hypothetical protein
VILPCASLFILARSDSLCCPDFKIDTFNINEGTIRVPWRSFRSSSLLTKREVNRVSAGIEKFDLKSPILDFIFLPDELIKTGLMNLTAAVGRAIRTTIFAGRGAV